MILFLLFYFISFHFIKTNTQMHSCEDIAFEQKKHIFIKKFANDSDIIKTCYQEITQCQSNLMNDYNHSLILFLKTDFFALKYLKNCSVNENTHESLNYISEYIWQKQLHLQMAMRVLNGDKVLTCPTVQEVCEIISTPNNTFFQFMLGTVDNNSNLQTLVNNNTWDPNLLSIIYEML
jgi:hypothetical protein